MMVEGSANISSGAVAVVGQSVAVDSNTAGAIALVHNRFVVSSVFTGAKSLVDSGLDFVLRQGIALCLINSGCQGSVVFRVRVAAFLRRNGNVTGKLGEQRGALCVLSCLTMLGGCPF